MGTIYVDGTNPVSGNGTQGNPYKTIQAGVNGAVPFDTVTVAPGTYNELVTVNKALFLYGGGAAASEVFPVIIGGGQTRANAILITASDVIVEGFKGTFTTGIGFYVRGPNIINAEIRNCFAYECSGSGIAAWGCPFGTDPVLSNWRGIQGLRVHHNIVERCCNAFWNPSGGFNEQVTVANGVYDWKVYNNQIRNSLNAYGDYLATNGGEGIDYKEGCELGEIYNNVIHHIQKNAIYGDAGRSNTLAGGYSLPAFIKNVHIYNNLVYANEGHGIVVTSEARFTDSATAANGRKGGSIQDIFIDYNTVYGNANAGILVYDYNLLTNPADPGWTLANVPLASNIQVVNNIAHGNNIIGNGAYSGIVWDHEWASGGVGKKNVSTGNFAGWHTIIGSPTLTGNINSDPLFSNGGSGDFTLQLLSPARDAGGDAVTNPTTDLYNTTRGALKDIGAIEATLSLTIQRGTTFDSRVYAPYIKNAFPAQSMPIGQTVNLSAPFYIAGGTSPTWSMTAVAGLSINASTGQITGAVTTAGTTSFRITCTNSKGTIQSAAVNWVVTSATWTMPSSFSGTIGIPADFDLSTQINAAIPAGFQYTGLELSATSAALPAGWTIDP